jgi:NADPH:quinone reductase
MKAAYIMETGPAENIQFGELPTPTPKDAEVLVKVNAVSVNPIDTYIRNGANYWELPKPYIPGADLAGQVAAVGPNAKRFKVGDRVWGSNQGLMGRQGVFAEFAAVDEKWLYPIPSGVSDEAAAACALVGITAHLGLFREAKLKAGETIFVHGGTGGVGAMVVQMAKAAGATVIATAGSPEKAALCKKLGADHVIEYKTQDEVAEVKKIALNGVNIFWETLREPDFDKIVPMMAERGRIVLMAGREARPIFPVGPFYVKGCSLLGFVMFKATPEEQRMCSEDINKWLASGQLKAQIAKTFPLSEAAAAHKLQEQNTLQKAGTINGKIVLKPQ